MAGRWRRNAGRASLRPPGGLAWLVALAVLASGCSATAIAGGSPSPPLSAPAASPSPSTGPAGTPTPSPPATPAPATVTIAFAGPMVGPDALLARPEFRAVQLAVAQANRGAFGPLPAQVLLLPVDTGGTVAGARAAAQEILADPLVKAVVGPPSTAEALAMGPVLDAGGIPFITPSATDPALAAQGWTEFFRATGTDAAVAPAIARYVAVRLRAACAVVASDGTAGGDALASRVAPALGTLGVSVAGTLTASTGRQFAHLAKRARRAGCGAVVFAGTGPEGGMLRAALASGGPSKVTMVGGGRLLMGGFPAAAGGSHVRTVAVCACADPLVAPGAAARKFVGEFQSSYGVPPAAGAAEAWDATQLLLAAMKAGKVRRAAITRFLRTVRDFPGLVRSYTFQADGNLAGKVTVRVFRGRAGGWVDMGTATQVTRS